MVEIFYEPGQMFEVWFAFGKRDSEVVPESKLSEKSREPNYEVEVDKLFIPIAVDVQKEAIQRLSNIASCFGSSSLFQQLCFANIRNLENRYCNGISHQLY